MSTTSVSGSSSPHDEEILNVFRERAAETLTTGEVAGELPIGQRATQNRLGALAEETRLVVEVDGKPKVWRLSDEEPAEPVRHPKIAEAERYASRASDAGRAFTLYGTASLAAAGFVMSYHVLAQTPTVSLPLFPNAGTVAVAAVVGVGGSILFALSFAAQLVAVVLPRIVDRRVEDRLGLDK